MPIEIHELNVKVNVSGTPDNGGDTPSPPSPDQGTSKDDIISECVEQVLEILKMKSER